MDRCQPDRKHYQLIGSTAVTGTGTTFTTELSIGSVIKTAVGVVIGTVASITDNTHLTLASNALITYSNITFRFQGVGPADESGLWVVII